MIKYLDSEYIKNTVIPVIFNHLNIDGDPVAHYEYERDGFRKLLGCLEMAKLRFYPRFFDKASYLYVQINKGHFFSNGNKRLALVVLAAFVFENNYQFRRYRKDRYQQKLQELFPDYHDYIDYPDFKSFEFAFYNMSVIIADSEECVSGDFDDLKIKVKEMLKFSIVK